MSRLIVLDGLDGSGKSTQFDRLLAVFPRLKGISFPDYDSPSASLVKMYLRGDFSDDPEGVSAYAASSFYAVDRYASFMLHWKDDYLKGTPILAGRYTTSNAIHQMSKLPVSEREAYLEWLGDYEYNKLGLPRPDRVIFLDIDPVTAQKRLSARYEGDETKKDIHEQDTAYMEKCRDAALYCAERDGWTVIPAVENGRELTADEITRKLCSELESFATSIT